MVMFPDFGLICLVKSKYVNTFGLANLANTIPAIHVELNTPIMLWIHMINIACGHSSFVALEPYLKRKFVDQS